MKKILIIMLLLLSACTPKVKEEIKEEKENIETSEPVVEEEQIEEETIKYKFDGSNILVFVLSGLKTITLFESKGMYPPTLAYMFLNENKDYIGFTYQYGEWTPIEGLAEQYPMEDGNLYGYRGKLTKLADNVYASKGAEVLMESSNINDENITVSDEVDFYVILNEEEQALYFCFEDLNLEELKKYNNENGKFIIDYSIMKELNQNQ